MTEWQPVAVIAAAILIGVFTQRLWLPSLLSTLRPYHISAVWANEKYSLTITQAENVIDQQQSALLDPRYGVVSLLTSIPGVRKVELAPKIVGGRLTGELVFRVTVERKRPVHELPSDEVIPQEIGTVRTDVVQA